jgi:glycosyltransferase involved in cell wall biosynthesis
MAVCDDVVVPSARSEKSPVVIQEAYAAGCPVIAAGIGGMVEKMIDGVTRLQFRAGDGIW